jgi:hypothetical protein
MYFSTVVLHYGAEVHKRMNYVDFSTVHYGAEVHIVIYALAVTVQKYTYYSMVFSTVVHYGAEVHRVIYVLPPP